MAAELSVSPCPHPAPCKTAHLGQETRTASGHRFRALARCRAPSTATVLVGSSARARRHLFRLPDAGRAHTAPARIVLRTPRLRHHDRAGGGPGSWSENVLEYFLRTHQILTEDGAEILWYHAANHKAQMTEALRSAAHMIEADVIVPGDGSEHGPPVMAHPPETHSDNTLQEWLTEVVKSNKGIKLDFKSLAAVEASMSLLEKVKRHLQRPVWINADILPGPNGRGTVVAAKPFIDTVTSFFPDVTFSLGWTTGWHPERVNEGYSWAMVKEMESICSGLQQPVTFPVRAALVRQSCSQLLWLLKQSNRYSLTIWAGKGDNYSTEDLLHIRESFSKRQVFYDILEPQNCEFKQAIGVKVNL